MASFLAHSWTMGELLDARAQRLEYIVELEAELKVRDEDIRVKSDLANFKNSAYTEACDARNQVFAMLRAAYTQDSTAYFAASRRFHDVKANARDLADWGSQVQDRLNDDTIYNRMQATLKSCKDVVKKCEDEEEDKAKGPMPKGTLASCSSIGFFPVLIKVRSSLGSMEIPMFFFGSGHRELSIWLFTNGL